MGATIHSTLEVKARVGEILRGLDHGEKVIITRRGRAAGRPAHRGR